MASIPKRLDGKVAVITGGASGIGAAAAKLFVQNGAKVIVADVQDDLGEPLCKELGTDDTVSYVHCNVSNEKDVKNAVDTAVSNYGKLDIMYNNAGILGDIRDQQIISSTPESFKKVLEVNALGALLGAKHAARVMIPQKSGVILFTASTATVAAGEGPHAYTMSKHAILGLMKNLSLELKEHGIRVNCISPCAVLTPFAKGSMNTMDDKMKEKMAAVLGKGGGDAAVNSMVEKRRATGFVILEAEEVAKAAVYLGSEESKSVSGLNLIVDEGDNGMSSMQYKSLLKSLATNIN